MIFDAKSHLVFVVHHARLKLTKVILQNGRCSNVVCSSQIENSFGCGSSKIGNLSKKRQCYFRDCFTRDLLVSVQLLPVLRTFSQPLEKKARLMMIYCRCSDLTNELETPQTKRHFHHNFCRFFVATKSVLFTYFREFLLIPCR